MAHIALVDVDDNGASAEWGALVTDDEYAAQPSI